MGAPHARVLNETAPIRPAATLIVVRDPEGRAQVLVGQRGSAAVFMPSKVVFPGGRVEHEDARVPLMGDISSDCRARLLADGGPTPEAHAAAAIRELWEETGQVLGTPADWPDPPQGWSQFAAAGFRPDATGLSYVFRAITPPGSRRRFDARFFCVDADRLASDPDDFSRAEDELSDLQWMPIDRARSFDLPLVTRHALAEITARLPDLSAPTKVPFFDGDDPAMTVERRRSDI